MTSGPRTQSPPIPIDEGLAKINQEKAREIWEELKVSQLARPSKLKIIEFQLENNFLDSASQTISARGALDTAVEELMYCVREALEKGRVSKLDLADSLLPIFINRSGADREERASAGHS